jgi:hypothetical protein
MDGYSTNRPVNGKLAAKHGHFVRGAPVQIHAVARAVWPGDGDGLCSYLARGGASAAAATWGKPMQAALLCAHAVAKAEEHANAGVRTARREMYV